MEKKDYIGLFETKEVKDKNQEDIKNSPLQEIGLQEPNIDENNKKAKSKVKTLSKAWLDLHEVEKMEEKIKRLLKKHQKKKLLKLQNLKESLLL